MRAKKRSGKRSNIPAPGVIVAIANHAAMGIALGLVFALILLSTPFFGVRPLIAVSDDPMMTMATFIGTVVVMFGIGAALTGSILMMEDAES